jgi:transposase
VGCTACGKTTQLGVPWAREGSGFTLLFEALALTMCRDLPVRQTARALRVRDKQLWRRIEHYVSQARRKQDMSRVRIVGIDETSLRRGHDYVTVVHDLDAKRLLSCTPEFDTNCAKSLICLAATLRRTTTARAVERRGWAS